MAGRTVHARPLTIRERYENDIAMRRVLAALALQRGHEGLANHMIQGALDYRNVAGDQGRLDRQEDGR